MSRLDIDFAAAPRRGPSLAGLALLLAGAAALTMVSLELDDLDQQTAVAEARLKGLTRRSTSTAAKSSGASKDATGGPAREALARLRVPWPELLEQIEALADLPVAILDLGADAQGRTLRLAGEAKNLDEVLAFVEKLRQGRRLDEVYLQGHEARKVVSPLAGSPGSR